jgi:hypothetical protein
MRIRTAIAAAALAIAPAVALAAQPLFFNVDGHVVTAKTETRVIQTTAGPMKVSTWSWHGPGGGSVIVRSSYGGAPPDWALAQMRAIDAQVRAMQVQLQQLQNVAVSGALTLPAPMPVLFAVPSRVGAQPVIIVEPARAPAAPAPNPSVRAPGMHI